MTVLGTEGSSSVSVQAELAQLKSENARLEAENARLRLEANCASSQLKAQRSHLLAQQDELRYEREVLNQEREQLQLEKARVKEEAEGWGMNRDRNDLIELLSRGATRGRLARCDLRGNALHAEAKPALRESVQVRDGFELLM